MKLNIFIILLAVCLLLLPVPLLGQEENSQPEKPKNQHITSDILEGNTHTLSGWVKYFEGDIEGAHEPDFDDSEWELWDSMWMNPRDLPNGWTGTRWYRHTLRVDSTMYNKMVALNVLVFGAAEVWLNDELVFQGGKISDDEETFEYADVRSWIPVQFSSDSLQVVAVRFSNPRHEFYHRTFFSLGVILRFKDLKTSRDEDLLDYSFLKLLQGFIVGFCLVFAIIHLLFYLFNRKLIFNLWFSIACFAYVFGSWVQQEFFFYTSVETIIRLQLMMQASMILSFAFLALFLYSALKLKKPLYFKILFWISMAVALLNIFKLIINPVMIICAGFLGIQILFVSIQAILNKKDGSWLLGGGALIFILSIFLVLGLEMSGTYMTLIGFSVFQLPYLTFGIALVAMSVYQSRHLAKLNLDLTRNLREVKHLSEKNLEIERSIRESEVQRAKLETENERKTVELEKARTLQLSLLPDTLPDSDLYSMQAAMHTATEVGGDYYDVIQKPDGTIIWAIGDATGHGTEAGFLAAMTKSLFLTLAPKLSADECLREMSAKLKEAGLRKNFMCLGLLTVQNETIEWCSAGIPAALLLRGNSSEIDLLESKGMPLGTVSGYPYQKMIATLQSGDIIVLMSDGLMEQMNAEREQFGMNRIMDCMKNETNATPEIILSNLKKCLDDWRLEMPQQDDVSLICLKKM